MSVRQVERLARQSAREQFPPAPPTAWKRRNTRPRTAPAAAAAPETLAPPSDLGPRRPA
jgi:hypothetical protein